MTKCQALRRFKLTKCLALLCRKPGFAGPAVAPPRPSSPRRTVGGVGSGRAGALAPRHPRSRRGAFRQSSLALFAAFWLGAAPRADAFSFGVEPSRIELAVPAGKPRGRTVRVANRSDQPVHIRTYVTDVAFLPDGTSDFPEAGSTPWSCASWIRVVPQELDLAPGEGQDVRVSVAAPPESRGGHYAMVFFETLPSYAEPGLNVNFRIGAFTQVTITGTDTYAASLADLTAAPSDIVVGVRNDGNALFRPRGRVKVFDARQAKVAQRDFNPERLGVLPGTVRAFHAPLDPLPAGGYHVKVEIDYGTKYLLVGEREFTIP